MRTTSIIIFRSSGRYRRGYIGVNGSAAGLSAETAPHTVKYGPASYQHQHQKEIPAITRYKESILHQFTGDNRNKPI